MMLGLQPSTDARSPNSWEHPIITPQGHVQGMGEYPGYYCYDANRPSWLPNWLDSLTESKCKWSPSTIAGNIKACATGDPSCNPPTSASALDPSKSGAGVAAPGEVVNVPQCYGLKTLNPTTNECEVDITSTPTLLLAGGVVFGLVYLLGGRR